LWCDELYSLDEPPFDIGPDSLYVAYSVTAEFSCHLALGWRLPAFTLDLFPEYRNVINCVLKGAKLIQCMHFYGVQGIEALVKQEMQNLAIRGGPFTTQERKELLEYNETDVIALKKLLPRMLPDIELPYALLRSRYMAAVATMTHNGVPVDVHTLDRIKTHWPGIKARLIETVNQQYGVYENGSFRNARWLDYCVRQGIPWPSTETGAPVTKLETFKSMAESYPQLGPIYELRSTLKHMGKISLKIGSDGCNRAYLNPFGSRSGRNQPGSTAFIFGPARWVRSLIKPPHGYGVAYIDWSQQEFAIAAAFSRDQNMLNVYAADDPYIEFAKLAEAVPEDATGSTHPRQRAQFKQCMLGVNYGMGPHSLASKIDSHVLETESLLQAHTREFSAFAAWARTIPDHILVHGAHQTPFGWTGRPGREPNLRSLRNFPIQGAGADIMRIAAIGIMETGIELLCPVHDAFLIQAPLNRLDEDIAKTREIMAEAGAVALDGLRLKTDVEIVHYPNRYYDKRGRDTWQIILGFLEEAEGLCA